MGKKQKALDLEWKSGYYQPLPLKVLTSPSKNKIHSVSDMFVCHRHRFQSHVSCVFWASYLTSLCIISLSIEWD